MKRRHAEIGAVILFCVAMIVVRVLWSARSEYHAAAAALAHSDTAEAIVHLRRAARWYAPGNPYVTRSLDSLTEIATRAESVGDIRTARSAWEAIRTAVLATRGLYTPHADRLEPANHHIAALLAREDSGASAEWHYALLARDDQPLVGWTMLALIGFCGWLAGAFGFILRGVDREDHLRPRAALWSAVVIVLGYAAFLIGLSRA